MEQINESGYLLQVFASLSQDIQMQTFNSPAMADATYLNPQNIDRMVEQEMNRIRRNCLRKEQQYVEQMLLQNPITIERRTNNNHLQQPSSEDEIVDVVTVSDVIESDTNTFIQKQRAEACRRSRYNNKIKKAKSKYRHEYMSQKLLQSTKMFDCIQDLIAKAERHLLSQGLANDKLQHLRQSYCVETASNSVRKIQNAMKMEMEN